MEKKVKKFDISAYMPVITVFLLIIVWQMAAMTVGAEIILPTPLQSAKELIAMFESASFYGAILSSLWKVALSFGIALVSGLLFAVLASASTVFERLFYPVIVVVRATPTMSVIFLCLIWFSSKISPMIVSLAVIFPMTYTNAYSAIKACDKRLLEMAKLYKVKRSYVFGKLYLPFVADKLYIQSTATLSFNVKLVIAAEALAATRDSLGNIMQIAKANLETARLFAVTVVALVLSVLLELALKAVRYFYRRMRYGKDNVAYQEVGQ